VDLFLASGAGELSFDFFVSFDFFDCGMGAEGGDGVIREGGRDGLYKFMFVGYLSYR